MIPAEFDYVAPTSLEEALSALREGGEDAKLLAGGHSLIPLMKLRLAAPTLLVDLRRVPGLSRRHARNGMLSFGAMVRHHTVATRRPRAAVARRRRRSPTSRSATPARSAGRWRTATRRRTCRRSCSSTTARSP